MNVYIETYGCSANQAHSEIMEGMLEANGLKIVKNYESADVIIINTCIVKTPTENRIRERLKFFVKNFPSKKLVITGCAADVGLFKDIAPSAIFLSSHKPKEIVKIILGKGNCEEKRKRKNNLISIVEISSGCLGDCSYCIVKLARGKLKSKKPEEIFKEVKEAIEEGCKEIWLTSQDCGCYGLDIGTNLAELVERIINIEGDFSIRMGMMNPTHIKPFIEKLSELYQNPKIYKFAHIPVQSGSDKILKAMKRGYSVKEFERIVKILRKNIPDITISTDIIVGFPGETENDFEKTLKFLKKVEPDIINLSKFEPRPKTEAAKMKQVDKKIVKKRSKKIAEIIRKISERKNRKWIGKECEIVVTEKGKKGQQFVGRNEYYKPVIIESKDDILGEKIKVKIIEAGQSHLLGEILKSSA